MDKDIILGTIFVTICLLGFYFAYLYGKKTINFKWREYYAMIFFPVVCVFILTYFYGFKIIELFIVSCFAGFFLEYIIGLAYHKTLNKRLWIYNRFSVGGYTSLLSIPLWGVAGVCFWFIAKIIGL